MSQIYDLGLSISCKIACALREDLDQPVHPRSDRRASFTHEDALDH